MDTFSKAERSAIMRRVRSRGTVPEVAVMQAAHALGFRPRQHPDLPGRPDLAFPRRRVALFVHGCFWHRHSCRSGRKVPATNQAYWLRKLERNRLRDARVRRQLRGLGWRTGVVWECQLRAPGAPRRSLVKILGARA
jgi:DNA mismatch endonuclease (patch repair protein)